jgi:thiol:disulfide interchange protein
MQKFRKQKPHAHGHHHHQEESILSAFILGASSGFIAAPCTTPVLTTILGYIATQHSVGLGTALMFSFALGLGTILVLVGTFTGALKVLPKSGAWLTVMKNASGYLIMGLGLYYVFKAGKLS